MRAAAQEAREVYKSGVVSYEKLRVGDLRSSKTLRQPEDLPVPEETVIQAQRVAVVKSQEPIIQELKGSKYGNLTEAEKQGREEVAEGIKSKGWVLMSTDKSSRLALTTKLMYGVGMQRLVSGDHRSSMEEIAMR